MWKGDPRGIRASLHSVRACVCVSCRSWEQRGSAARVADKKKQMFLAIRTDYNRQNALLYTAAAAVDGSNDNSEGMRVRGEGEEAEEARAAAAETI